ncbi:MULTISPECIES: hypothetical protein [Actinomadura]|uniref:Uncharacterized protein n=1 Tax=Actinomadura yumaensis TaxID=111807 RepID=A0ABW2CJ26_9ACTN|nr:hypothetical protein [Actinomadura sp. J1-007]
MTATGRALIAGLVEALPPAAREDGQGPGGERSGPAGIAARLWTRLCRNPPTRASCTPWRAR